MAFLNFWFCIRTFTEIFRVGINRKQLSGEKWKSIRSKLAFHVRTLGNWWTSVDFKCYTFFRFVGIWKVNSRHMLQWLPIATPVIQVGFKQPFNPTCPHSLIPKASHADCFGGWHFTCVSSSLFCMYLSKHLSFFHHHITQVWMNLGWQHSCEEWRGSEYYRPHLTEREN